ncbi:MAG: hypothetical protein U9Q40_04330 [Campylobacterota bacterium]|nr:hypothetical protein [Campylobacterota bacterium]
MKNFILMTIITLLISACAPSSLKVNSNNELILQHNSKEYAFPGTIVDSDSLSFQKIDVEQVTLKESNGEKFYYEQVTIDIDYEFQYGSITTLKYIFDVSRTNIIHKSSNILLMQLRVEDDKYINLMAEISATQDMAYIYGFSNRKLLKIANELNAQRYEIKNSYELTKPKTEWSQEKLLLQPLIKPMFRRGPF